MNYKITQRIEPTKAALAAIQNIKNAIRKEVLTPNRLVRQPGIDLLEKRHYMNTEAFWNDPHNKKMAAISEELIGIGDGIGRKNVLYRNVITKLSKQASEVKNAFSFIKG